MAVKLGLKKAPDLRVEEYYPTYLSMAKNFMEGKRSEVSRDVVINCRISYVEGISDQEFIISM